MYARVSTFEGVSEISPETAKRMGEAIGPLLKGLSG